MVTPAVASTRLLLYYYSVNRIFEILNKININGSVTVDEDMSKHTTFKCGGLAEFYVRAGNSADILNIKKASLDYNFPLFILGGGANILVSDKGIPGVTLSMESLNSVKAEHDILIAEAGISINKLAQEALDRSLSGLEFINGMPGSLGGAVWMNARCYGDEISNHFLWADYLTPEGVEKRLYKNDSEWDYKCSPFQKSGIIITRVALQLQKGNPPSIEQIMKKNSEDRRLKGHFSYPCAGSVFKNNREFGAPSGKIIEDAGLKGLIKGGAQISTFHGNIIVNIGHATSSDINFLIEETIAVVKEKKGFILEPEVLKIGNWE